MAETHSAAPWFPHEPVDMVPGFWLVEWKAAGGKQHTIAMVPQAMLSPEMVRANHILITAAPELLAACVAAKELLGVWPTAEGDLSETWFQVRIKDANPVIDQLEAAIWKAVRG